MYVFLCTMLILAPKILNFKRGSCNMLKSIQYIFYQLIEAEKTSLYFSLLGKHRILKTYFPQLEIAPRLYLLLHPLVKHCFLLQIESCWQDPVSDKDFFLQTSLHLRTRLLATGIFPFLYLLLLNLLVLQILFQ